MPGLTHVNRIREERVKCPRENECPPDSISVFEARRMETKPRRSEIFFEQPTQPSLVSPRIRFSRIQFPVRCSA